MKRFWMTGLMIGCTTAPSNKQVAYEVSCVVGKQVVNVGVFDPPSGADMNTHFIRTSELLQKEFTSPPGTTTLCIVKAIELDR